MKEFLILHFGIKDMWYPFLLTMPLNLPWELAAIPQDFVWKEIKQVCVKLHFVLGKPRMCPSSSSCYRKEVSKCRILGGGFRKVWRDILSFYSYEIWQGCCESYFKARCSSFIVSIVTLWINIMLNYTKKASVCIFEYLFLWLVCVFVTGHIKI